MRFHRKTIAQVSAIVACCCLAAMADHAQAVQESSVLLAEPANTANVTTPAEGVVTQETLPAEVIANAKPVATDACCPKPCIAYHADHKARRRFACEGTTEMVMMVDNPADCTDCTFEVPLCLPACCTGEPTTCSRTGILGHGVVEYCWPCGFEVKVKFRHVLGDIKVKYDG